MAAKVYLVGAGPGDPGLITVRGQELLARAEVLVFDAPCSPVLLDLVPPSAERIAVGRWPDGVKMHQADIDALLVDRARQGKTVVRLKNGDPYMFGRGGDEALALAEAGLPFEVIPGVTCGLAAAAFSGIPFTQRGISSEALFVIAQSGGDWGLDLERLARVQGTLVLHLDPPAMGPIAAELVKRGRSGQTPVALVESAGGPGQRTFEGTLADIGERTRDARPPAVAFIGEAVRLRQRLAWAERRPLFGKAVVITRPRDQAQEMASLLEEQGAEVVELPCIAIAPPASMDALDCSLADLSRFDWVVFSSANGVASFLSRLGALGKDARSLATVKIAAVGPATARELSTAHLCADAVPAQFNAEELARLLGKDDLQGKRFLLVRAQEGREVLADELRRAGAEVEIAAAYRTICPPIDPEPLRARFKQGTIAAITFASPSAAKNFVGAFGPGEAVALLSGVCVAAIGKVTGRALEELGVRDALAPAESTGPALVAALIARLGQGAA